MAGLADRPDLLLESLEASTASLAILPNAPPALFNRALALSRLNLSTTARSAWETYRVTAPQDDWSLEAEGFLARSAPDSYQQRWRSEVEPALRRAALRGDRQGLRVLVASHRQRSREWAERELLPQWASESDEDAGEALEIARRIGNALAEISGDRMLAEGVKAIGDATPAGRERLRKGHRELSAGVDELYLHWRLERARGHFRRARKSLSESPYALWADFYLGLVTYYQGNYDPAAATLQRLEKRVSLKRHPALEGRVRWVQGLTAAATFRLEDSAAHYLRALQIFCASEEEENLATVHALRGEILHKLGLFEESWRHFYNALAMIDRIFDPIRRHAVLEAATLSARRQGLYHAGLVLSDEHLAVARRIGSAQILHYAFMHRASFRHLLGNLRGAKTDLAEAAHAAEGLKDPDLRQRTAADFELVSAEIEAETDPGRAIPLLNRTIAQYESKEFAYLLPQAYGARAQAFLGLGDLASAEQDLARQIRIYEGSADGTHQDVFRLSLLDQAAPAFDEMIELQATKLDRPVLGLEYCERGRYRAFLNAWRNAPGLPFRSRPLSWIRFDPRRLQDGLPEGVAIIEYSLLDGHLLSWVITRSGVEMAAQRVPRQDLARRIRGLGRALAREGAPAASQELYDLLVRPAEPLLGGASHLVIVPDKELFLVPFEALIDRQTGRFLIEDRLVSYAPSASLWVHLREKMARPAAPQLVVAATGALNGGARYERLPQAPAEARAIAALHPRGRFLPNPDKKTFLSALSKARVLHFSGHAVSNAEQPFASKLVLADTATEQVELYTWELYDRTFSNLELVVLSACGTVKASRPGLGMAATLAGPFLAAGVPQVIGSQWRVEDEPTRRFFEAFHRHLAQGADAPSALRATKLAFLHSGNADLASPRVWGAFVLVGG
jgi:CHAT domain-containing protein